MRHPNTPLQLHAGYEGTIVSSRQPMLTFEQCRAMFGIFGFGRTVRTLVDKRIGESDILAIDLTVDELAEPLHLRKTHSDFCSIVDVFCRRIYDLPQDIRRSIGSKAIVDLGAYNGTTPAYFANHYPDSPILAAEPNARNYPILRKNTEPYRDQVTAIQAAATPIDGPVTIRPFGFATDSMQNAFLLGASSQPDTQPIASLTPTDILERVDDAKVGILKVDIEGAEEPFFRSPAIDELLRQTGVLLIETHDQFMPGASTVVRDAAVRNGLEHSRANKHTTLYYRSKLEPTVL